MTNKYRIDGHKLMYHPCELCNWLHDEKIYPIYIEISPCNHCNHRCSFCSFDFTGYDYLELDTNILKATLSNIGEVGVKAVMYAGEGEPLIHKDIISIINHTKECELDVAVTTNGVLMDESFIDGCLKSLSWIKISIDSSSSETYAKIHGTNSNDLEKVYNNLEYTVKYKKENGLECVIGTQAILLKDNKDDLEKLVLDMRNIGVDYIVIKPYTNHPYRKEKMDIYYDKTLDKLTKYTTNKFNVIVRGSAFKDLEVNRDYNECNALDFWTYIDSKGDVYSCSNFLSNQNYVYGNIHDNTFKDIWDNRKDMNIDIGECRKICRMNKVNKYLWDLKYDRVKHKNFI